VEGGVHLITAADALARVAEPQAVRHREAADRLKTMRSKSSTTVLLGAAVGIGIVLDVLCIRTASSFSAFAVFLFFWGMAPYLVLLVVPRFARNQSETIGAIVAVVVLDLVGRMSFLFPTSSTAALVLLWLPFWLLLVAIPVGLYTVRFVLWLQGRMHGSQSGV
jgi:hypothetical protein